MTDAGNQKTILLVDDDENILATAAMMLEAVGYAVEKAPSGEAAQALADKNPSRFDLLITDLSMPDMDGRQVVAALREQGFNGPALLLSGYAVDEEEFADTFDGVVYKPFRLDTLKQQLDKLLG